MTTDFFNRAELCTQVNDEMRKAKLPIVSYDRIAKACYAGVAKAHDDGSYSQKHVKELVEFFKQSKGKNSLFNLDGIKK